MLTQHNKELWKKVYVHILHWSAGEPPSRGDYSPPGSRTSLMTWPP